MIVTRPYKTGSWLDVTSPTAEEIDSLMLSHNIDPSVARDLATPTPKQYVRDGENFVYLIVHVPVFGHSNRDLSEFELDCIITENDLVSVRYESIDALHYFAKQLEVEDILHRSTHPHAFIGIMKEIYKFLQDELSYIDGWLRDIEQNIFSGKEKDMVLVISRASRNLLSFRRTVNPHKQLWQNLHTLTKDKFSKEFNKEVVSLLNELDHILVTADNLTLMIDELRETNNSMLSTKQNEIMKIFTIMAFVTFPLSLIAAIFGMNTISIPIVGEKGDFWIVISIMIASTLAMFGFFRYKRWL